MSIKANWQTMTHHICLSPHILIGHRAIRTASPKTINVDRRQLGGY